jgi:hypothetical protein
MRLVRRGVVLAAWSQQAAPAVPPALLMGPWFVPAGGLARRRPSST